MRILSVLVLALLLATGVALLADPAEGLKAKPVDLLSRVNLKKHLEQGYWNREGKELVSVARMATDTRNNSYFEVPIEFPNEFVLTMDVTRENECGQLILNFRHLKRKISVFLDREQGTRSGPCPVDGLDFDQCETTLVHNRPVFPTSVPVTVRLEVRKTGIRITAGDWVLVDWEGTLDRLGDANWLDIWTTQNLLVGSQASAFRITRMELTPPGSGD